MLTLKTRIRAHEHDEFCTMMSTQPSFDKSWGLFAQFTENPCRGIRLERQPGRLRRRWETGCVPDWDP